MNMTAHNNPPNTHDSALGNLEDYLALASTFVKHGYACVTLEQFSPSRKDLILRHDIDINIDAAVEMATRERERGFLATYYALLTSEFYNLMSKSGRIAIRAIAEMGHEIGLHFDTAVYASADEIDEKIMQECNQLEQILGCSVKSVSPHRPGRVCSGWLAKNHSPAGRNHPYQTRFFSEARYYSDSPGYWGHGNPLEHLRSQEVSAAQILTHPHLWCGAPPYHRDAQIRMAIHDRLNDLRRSAEEHFSGFVWNE